MSNYRSTWRFVVVALFANLAVAGLHAQSSPAPTVYTVTEVNSMFGPAVNLTIYRNGMKAVIDSTVAPDASNPKGTHVRTLYDLQNQTNYSWDTADAGVPCGGGSFSGDWGDPFAMSAGLSGDFVKQGGKETGTETVNGIATRVLEASTPQAKIKVWLDPKSGLLIRAMMTAPNGDSRTMIDVKQVSLVAPAASIFMLPAKCAAVAKTPKAPSEQERIAAETGSNAADFANAIMGPGSKDSCSVAVRVVNAGTMQAITSGFQIAVDTAVNLDHPGGYTIGVARNGGPETFSGGGLHEMTAQLKNGVLRIANAPPYFDVETHFGNAGDASALIYRQCAGPQSVLLFVVKNPQKLSDGGDWLWVKSGKFAKVE